MVHLYPALDNYTCGSSGRHLGIGCLKNGGFYLCHGTLWEGERNYAEVIDEETAKKTVLEYSPGLYKAYFGEEPPLLSA